MHYVVIHQVRNDPNMFNAFNSDMELCRDYFYCNLMMIHCSFPVCKQMNLMCNWDKNSPKKTADFQLTFPQLTEYPALSKMKLRLGSEIQEAIQSREAAFLWGELTDDEMISVALTTERNQVRIVLIHPMNLEPLPKEIRVVLRQNDELSDMATFDVSPLL